MKQYISIILVIFTILLVGCDSNRKTREEYHKEMAEKYAFLEHYYSEPVKEIPLDDLVDYMLEHRRAEYVSVRIYANPTDTIIFNTTMPEHIYRLALLHNAEIKRHNNKYRNLEKTLDSIRARALDVQCTDRKFNRYVKKYAKKYDTCEYSPWDKSYLEELKRMLKIIDKDTTIYDTSYYIIGYDRTYTIEPVEI